MLLPDKFIERVRTHARGKRRTISALRFDIFVISKKVRHEENYGARVKQAIVPASLGGSYLAFAACFAEAG